MATCVDKNGPERAESLGLAYVGDEHGPGITRRRCGRGFAYYTPEGELIGRGSDLRDWIESLAIPPAWAHVWIAPSRDCHMLATGRDDAGRKQYIYHPHWEKGRQETVFHRMRVFGKALPKLRQIVAWDLSQKSMDRRRVLAAAVRLLDLTLIRIGNHGSALNGSGIGATTLTRDHLIDKSDTVLLRFKGKGGKDIEMEVADRQVLAVLRAGARNGTKLFAYRNESGEWRGIDASDVNAYLKEATGEDFTAKDFRTWGGSTRFADHARRHVTRWPDADPENIIRKAIQRTAEHLKNTPEISRSHYVHFGLPECVRDGSLARAYRRMKKRRAPRYALTVSERLTLKLIAACE